MITVSEYFSRFMSHPDATPERKANAGFLLSCVANLQAKMENEGNVVFRENPLTESEVSGEIYGGFRPQDCPQGALHSSHKEGAGVDIYDPKDELDSYIDQFETGDGGNTLLAEFGLYREAPASTPKWLHVSIHSPASGRRTFQP